MTRKPASSIHRTIDTLQTRSKRLLFRNLVHKDSPVHAGDTLFRGSALSHAHTHDFYEFYLVRKGAVVEYRDRTKKAYCERTLVFIPPTMLHCFACDASCHETIISNVALSKELLLGIVRLLNPAFLRKRYLEGFVLEDVGLPLWELMVRRYEMLKPGPGPDYGGKDVVVKAMLMDMAAEMAGNIGAPEGSKMPLWLAEACSKMQSPENTREGLRRFIALSGRTQEHLTRTLRATAGLTPTAFINRLRLKQVAERLRMSGDPVTMLAMDAGFNNLAHFNQRFRKEFGVSPREYRKARGAGAVP